MKKLIVLLTSLIVNINNAQVTFTLNANICSSTTNTLTANTGTDIALSYTWGTSPSLPVFSSPNASVTNINIPTSGTYTINLNVTLSSGFSSYSSTVNVTQTPTVTLAQSTSTVCIVNNSPKYSKLVTFTASGSYVNYYTWNPLLFTQGANNSIAMSQPIFPVCYTVSSTVGSCIGKAVGCISITPQYSIAISPNSPTVCLSDSTQLYISNIGTQAVLPIQKYKWYDPVPVSIANSSVNPVSVSPSVTSTYTVEVVDNDGCVSLPSLVSVSVLSCTGIHSNSINETILSIYPNPASDILNVEITDAQLSQSVSLKLQIINTLGQTLQTTSLQQPTTSINIKELPIGIYFIKITKNDSTQIIKLIKN